MIALSRWALNDAFLTIFSTLSLISYITNIKEKKITPIPGIFLALAFLTKPNGILPIIAWLIISLLNRDKKAIKLLVVNLSVAASLIYLLWPSMYTNPFYIIDYFIRQTQLTQSDFRNYFFGVTNNPPFYYYLFQIGTRVPTIIMVGFLLGILLITTKVTYLKKFKTVLFEHSMWVAIVVYSVIFYLVIDMASKKLGARYALPLWPWIYLVSVLAWYKLLKPFNRIFLNTFVIIVFFSFIYTIRSYTPQLYFYYNSLVGGPINAQNYDLPNLCLGAKSVGEFVNSYPDIAKITYLGCGASIFSYYSSKQITTNWKDSSNLVVVEDSYQKLLPNEDFIRYFNSRQPLAVISEKGIILARVYSND